MYTSKSDISFHSSSHKFCQYAVILVIPELCKYNVHKQSFLNIRLFGIYRVTLIIIQTFVRHTLSASELNLNICIASCV